jgi:hypothetical protein
MCHQLFLLVFSFPSYNQLYHQEIPRSIFTLHCSVSLPQLSIKSFVYLKDLHTHTHTHTHTYFFSFMLKTKTFTWAGRTWKRSDKSCTKSQIIFFLFVWFKEKINPSVIFSTPFIMPWLFLLWWGVYVRLVAELKRLIE